MNSTILQSYFSEHSILNENSLDLVELTMKQSCLKDEKSMAGKILQDHISTGGKRLRARLALSALSAVGKTRSDGIYWASAVEILHNTTLIHDDIQDGDLCRRGKPTSWVLHGIPQAINAGDLGLMLPFLMINSLDISNEKRCILTQWLAQSAITTVQGQSQEMELLPKHNFSRGSYLKCVEKKTGSFFSLPVKGAALIGGISKEECEKLGDAFLPLGILFQMQDDILDLYGDKGREARGSDLREGKVSNLVIEHLHLVPTDRNRLITLLQQDRNSTPQSEVDLFIDKFKESGALDVCLHQIQVYADTVLNSTILKKYPYLYQMAEELIYLALHPIEELIQ